MAMNALAYTHALWLPPRPTYPQIVVCAVRGEFGVMCGATVSALQMATQKKYQIKLV